MKKRLARSVEQGADARVARKKSGRVALFGGVIALLAVLFAMGFWPRWHALRDAKADLSGEALPTVVYIVAERGKPSNYLALPASIKPFQETTLYSRTNGYLKRWLVDIGDHVKEGQLLAEIEAPELGREIQQAQASLGQVKAHLKLAQITAERYQGLRKEDAVSFQEADEKVGVFEARKADYAAAEANLKRLEQIKSFQRVLAPFAGTITTRNVEIGSLIQAGSSSSSGWLFKIVQMDKLRIHVSVPQSHISMIQPGMSAELNVTELGQQSFAAKVDRSAGALDPATRTMVVELLADNPGHKITPGMYGQVKFQITQDKPNLIVPVTALMVGGDGIRLATLDAANAVRIKKVKVGRDHGKEVEIVEGLADKERVINNPRDTLEEGLKVKAVLQEKSVEKKEEKKEEKTPPKPMEAAPKGKA